MRRTVAAAVATVAAVSIGALAACSSSKHASGGRLSGTITVDAASSLSGAFSSLASRFEAAHPGTKIVFNFGASSTLATQITQGQPADVFASASTKNMTTVVSANAASSPVTFVRNTGEIATAPNNPHAINGLADLAKPGLKVALCEPAVPCGAVATSAFAKAGVTVRPAALEPDVKSTLAAVEGGEVDAGIVYVTDVKAAGTKVTGIAIPTAQNATTDYPIAVLTASKNVPLAQAFVAYVTSSAGLQVLTAAGFLTP